jgi:tungstate transport system ATP-binding protein
MNEIVYRVTDLRVEFSGRRVLDIGALSIPRGHITAVVGPNGAGKTTLLQVLAFLRVPTAGRLEFGGQPVPCTERQRAALRRQVTLVAQSPLLFRRSVRANITYGLRAHGLPRGERIDAALSAVGLTGFGPRPAWRLSGGETQRVAIARALAIDPPVYLLDEPTSNVDREHVSSIERVIAQLGAAGKTVVLTTHNLDQAYRLTDSVVSLVGGGLTTFPLVNLLRGTTQSLAGTNYFCCEGLRIEVANGTAPAAIVVDPEDIVISREPLHSSARNCFAGKIIKVESDRGAIVLTVNCGRALVARITRRAYAELNLNVGTPVYVTLTSTAIHSLDDAAGSASA